MSWHSTDNGKTWSAGRSYQRRSRLRPRRTPRHGGAPKTEKCGQSGWTFAKKACGSTARCRMTEAKPGRQTSRSMRRPTVTSASAAIPPLTSARRANLYAMWRNWLSGSRDMYYAVSTDRRLGRSRSSAQGTWPVECLSDGRRRTGAGWQRRSFIRRGGGTERCMPRPVTAKEVALGKGKNPAIAVGQDGAYIVWTEGTRREVDKARR